MTPDPDLFTAIDVESPTAKMRAVPTAGAPLTAGPGPLPAELSNPAFEPWVDADESPPLSFQIAEDDPAEILHALACGCPRLDDRDAHDGYDFTELGAAFEAKVHDKAVKALLAGYDLVPRGETADPTVQGARHALAVTAPIEAKVSAGALASLAGTVVLAVTTAVLSQFDTFRPLFGSSPWSGPLVLVVGALLTGAQSWAGYQAPHTPRCDL